MLDELT